MPNARNLFVSINHTKKANKVRVEAVVLNVMNITNKLNREINKKVSVFFLSLFLNFFNKNKFQAKLIYIATFPK